MAKAKDYDVGYGKPPKAGQFRRGMSGNPKGRPKGTQNLKTDLEQELKEKINVVQDGKPLLISKQRALVKALMVKAVKGDNKAAGLLFNMMLRLMQMDETPAEFATLSESDKQILARFEKEILEASKKTGGKSHV